jgi:hypothetical protein
MSEETSLSNNMHALTTLQIFIEDVISRRRSIQVKISLHIYKCNKNSSVYIEEVISIPR